MKVIKPKLKYCEKCKFFKEYENEGHINYQCDWQNMGTKPINMEWNPEAEDGLGKNKYARFRHNRGFVIPKKCPFILEHSLK